MNKMKTTITFMFFVLLLSIWSIGNIYAQNQNTGEQDGSIGIEAVQDSGNCQFKKNSFVAGRGGTTTSTTFVAVPFVNISVTNNRKSCFRITFSAEAFPSGTNNVMFIEARIDGSTTGVVPNTGQQFVGVSSIAAFAADYHTAVFTKKNVAAGTHNVEMFYRSESGADVSIHEFHLDVDYKR